MSDLDLTPLDLPELEQYLFQTREVLLQDLPEDLTGALVDIAQPICDVANGSPGSMSVAEIQLIVDQALIPFNAHDIQEYSSGVLASLKAYITVYNPDFWSRPITYDAYVEYTGITQAEADCLPRHIVEPFYRKYLKGYSSLYGMDANTFGKCIQQGLKPFLGQIVTPHIKQMMRDCIVDCIKALDPSMNPIISYSGNGLNVVIATPYQPTITFNVALA